MDGNRRWAKKHKLEILRGHQYAADNILEKIVEHGAKIGIKYLTFWAFSTENWHRDKFEVEGLMNILRNSLKTKIKSFIEKGVRLKVIGDISVLSKDLQSGIENAVDMTKNGKAITVVMAINYGGRDEIIRAFNKINRDLFRRHSGESFIEGRLQNRLVRRSSSLKNEGGFWTSPSTPSSGPRGQNDMVKEEEFSKYLDTKDIPDPDLIIRTGGEQRLSGFLLWQSEYSELYFTDTLWPDFSPKGLDLAIEDFKKRQRRFGR